MPTSLPAEEGSGGSRFCRFFSTGNQLYILIFLTEKLNLEKLCLFFEDERENDKEIK